MMARARLILRPVDRAAIDDDVDRVPIDADVDRPQAPPFTLNHGTVRAALIGYTKFM